MMPGNTRTRFSSLAGAQQQRVGGLQVGRHPRPQGAVGGAAQLRGGERLERRHRARRQRLREPQLRRQPGDRVRDAWGYEYGSNRLVLGLGLRIR